MAQLGRALPWGGRGRGFKSRRSDQLILKVFWILDCLIVPGCSADIELSVFLNTGAFFIFDVNNARAYFMQGLTYVVLRQEDLAIYDLKICRNKSIKCRCF